MFQNRGGQLTLLVAVSSSYCFRLMRLAAELLPPFLSNIPYALTLTWDTYLVSTYTSLAILGAMVLVPMLSMGVRWLHMLVDLTAVAGMMYYVVKSDKVLKDVTWAGAEESERREDLRHMGGRDVLPELRVG